MARDQRRLAAIVSADVVGYSRLMGVNEGGTLASLKSHRHALIDPKISEYCGRIVKTTGDGLLMEFPSVVDAVRCAVDVQRGMAERNAGAPPDQRVAFRIGINVGDIIIDGDDIFGDGVNVAARLQALAEPGEICVSKVVRDQVLDKLSFTFEDLGAQRVKNIARPVETYRVNLESDALPLAGNGRRRLQHIARSRTFRWLGAGVVALSVAGIAAWTLPRLYKATQVPEPPAFSVAVLPFAGPGGTSADQQFGEFVVHGIAKAIGRTVRYVTVVLPPPSAQANQVVDIRAFAREHNVRYVLQGTVRVEGDTVKVSAKLIDAESSAQVWASDFAAARSKWTGESAEPAYAVSRELREALWSAEERRVMRGSAQSASTPLDLVVRATLLERPPTPKRLAETRALVDEALRQDPNLVLALREVIEINALKWENDPNADRVQLAQEMDEFARRALGIDRTDPGIWRDRAFALMMLWRWDAALDALKEAHRLDPAHVADAVNRGWLLSMMGRADETLRIADEALARDPSLDANPGFRHNQCYAQVLLGRFEEAIASCEKSIAGGDDWWPYFFVTVAYAQTGDMARAATSKAELLRRQPGFSITRLNTLGLSDNPLYLKQVETNVLPGLRKAGIPER